MTLTLDAVCMFSPADPDGAPEDQNSDWADLEACSVSGTHRRAVLGVAIASFRSFFAIARIWESTSGIETRIESVWNTVANSLLGIAPSGVIVVTERTRHHTLLTVAGGRKALPLVVDVTPGRTAD